MPTYALSLLGREARERMASALPEGLRLGHLAVLGALIDSAPRTQRQLSDLLAIHPSDLVSIVDDLVSHDLATRSTDPADRRRNLVHPMPAGRELVQRATRDSEQICRDLLAALSPAERETVNHLLSRALSGTNPA